MLSEETWNAWHAQYEHAASSLDDREVRVAAIAEALETDMELLGVTAIEDKLQVSTLRVTAVLRSTSWLHRRKCEADE